MNEDKVQFYLKPLSTIKSHEVPSFIGKSIATYLVSDAAQYLSTYELLYTFKAVNGSSIVAINIFGLDKFKKFYKSYR